MIATVTAINYNVQKTSKAGKAYTVTEFSYQGPVYKGQVKPPTTRRVFKNDPIHDVIETLKIGDQIELTFNQDQYKSINTIVKKDDIEKTDNSTSVMSNGHRHQDKDDETPVRIARSVALKAAVDTINSYLSGGLFKKTIKPEILDTEIISRAREYEKYLTLNDVIDEINNNSMEAIDEVFEQETFE